MIDDEIEEIIKLKLRRGLKVPWIIQIDAQCVVLKLRRGLKDYILKLWNI